MSKIVEQIALLRRYRALRRLEQSSSRFIVGMKPALNLKQAYSPISPFEIGGAERDRTVDPLLAKQVLSQLSYSPIAFSISESWKMVGLGRFELPTSPLSGVRSNQLSYRPGIRIGLSLRETDSGPDCLLCGGTGRCRQAPRLSSLERFRGHS